MLRSNVVLLLLAAAPLAGCTAGLAVGRIVDAQKVVRDAEAKGAADLAAYEYRLAVRHLDEAWEEHGDAEFKTSMTYAERAKTYAEQAILRTEGGGRDLQELRKDVENLDDLLGGEELTPETAPSGPAKAPLPTVRREKAPEEEQLEDFVDEAGDDEIDIEGEPEPAPPPPPPPKAPAPKADPSSPWGKRK